MRETVLQLLDNEKYLWSSRKSLVTRNRVSSASLAEQMHAQIDSGDKFYSIEITPPISVLDSCQLLRSLQNLYNCSPLFTAITWHIKTSAMPVPPVLPFDRPERNNDLKLDRGFPYASDLVSFIQERFGDYFTICVAGYPLGHPEAVSFEQDLAHLKEKVDKGASFIITQFFFKAGDFVNFVQWCRRIGITVPIIPGILLIQDYTSLIHISSACSVEVPRSVLDIIEPIKDNREAVRKFGVHLAVEMVSYLFSQNYSNAAHFFTLNRQLSVIETCKCLGFCLLEPARPLMHHERCKKSKRIVKLL
ncbi:methylenetetrahydrofolate reductase isoform X4 [Cryptotermes secundus]|uniref:methylenetetrahydrofolate reductase isoform X4 n=1 Tax=Cryptotermes secundus TaxID=105785 RepID=UPI000CD7C6BD|nr:methylenetetrahydrofolate reductase isoform X4 [Cryptotermes secundus]